VEGLRRTDRVSKRIPPDDKDNDDNSPYITASVQISLAGIKGKGKVVPVL
jgi:hypothetical protein